MHALCSALIQPPWMRGRHGERAGFGMFDRTGNPYGGLTILYQTGSARIPG
jgi:hypothetical protein